MPRFAANLTMMFNEFAFLDRFAAAAAAGFEAVECLFPYEHAPNAIELALKQAKLTLALFNLPPGDWQAGERGIASLAGREGEFSASLDFALSYAKASGVKRLHVMAGKASKTDRAARGRYRGALREAAEFFASHGIDILIEPLNTRDNPGYLLDDFDFAADLIGELALPNLKLQFDLYHCQIVHGDVTTRLRRYLPLIGHVQVASVPSRHEPGSEELNAPFIFAELDRLGYAGFVGCEYRPQAGTREGLGWFAPYRSGSAMVQNPA